MSEMIERVARAIGVPEAEGFVCEWSLAAARAAIEAMHEPTKEMIDAGKAAYMETSDLRDAYVAMSHAAFSREFPY